MKKIQLKNTHKKYFLFQRNEYLSSQQIKIRKLLGRYLFTKIFINFFNSLSDINDNLNKNFKKEFNDLIDHLPRTTSNILDIGSGLGVIDIYLNEHYNQKPNFTLIDKNFIEKKVYYGFNSSGQAYNNFKITKDFLLHNGLNSDQLSIFDADSNLLFDVKFDLVVSLLSMGYHYPLDQYLSVFKNNTHKNTVFIIDIAEEYNDKNQIFNLFDSAKILYKSSLPRHNYIRICCIGFKK
ncbi:MAG: hypothetical protein CMI90_05685 [Pelagibacteraceae bacterium]|nr:hypothetical protein [Pelagibacteraceae bacterium]